MTNLAIIEDDLELKDLLEKYFSYQEDIKCVLAVESIEDFLTGINSTVKPDVVLSDIGLPGLSGVEGIQLIKKKLPEVQIVMLTVHDDSDNVFQSICNGASGYILKNTPLQKIKESIDILAKGGSPMSPSIARKVIEYFNPSKKFESPLTEREHDIVQGLVDGLSYKLIADRFDISLDTVRQHIRNIYRKLNVNSKGEVISKKLRGEI